MGPGLEAETLVPAHRAGRVEVAFARVPPQDAADGWDAAYLSSRERAYVARLRFSKRRREWLAGRLAGKAAVRALLRRARGTIVAPECVEILRGDGGQPVVHLMSSDDGVCDLAVSISHSGGLAGAAAWRVSEAGAVGLDLERMQEVDPTLYDLAFSPVERLAIDQTVDTVARTRLVLRMWTAKEAVLKAVQLGLSVPLTAVRILPRLHPGPWRATLDAGASPKQEGGVFQVHVLARAEFVLALAYSSDSREGVLRSVGSGR